jgi:hypothetical protein
VGQELEIIGSQKETMVFRPCPEEAKEERGERGLLLQAFEMFIQAFSQLQAQDSLNLKR